MHSGRGDDLRSRLVALDPDSADTLERETGIRRGTQIGARYVPQALLSTSGLATVIQAWDTAFCRQVVVKLALPDERWEGCIAGARIDREATALGLVASPQVVRRLDAGQDPECGAYVVTEFLPGTLLALEPRGMSVRRAVRIAYAILEGLAACHAAGIVQWDLKPANVMLVPFDEGDLVVLFDFNIVVLPGEVRERFVNPDTVMGTPGYLAPEQVLGRPVDARVNIYLAGLILYELLTGTSAFYGSDIGMIAEAARRSNWPVCEIRSEVPQMLEEVVQRAMALDPRARFQTAREFQRALDPFLACEPPDEPTG